jgi:flagellar protein FliS
MYSDIQLSTDVETASPHQLIQMLYQRCLQEIKQGKAAIVEKNHVRKFKALNKAVDIVEHLQACLKENEPQATELVKQLQTSYTAVVKYCLNAALTGDVTNLDHAEKIMGNIKSGWDGISR